MPAYWWGLERWENPRLASSLFMALLASLCVPLVFLYLARLGAEPWAAFLATGLMAVTGPFFHYTNQLYPEVPALLIALVALVALSHWQVPGGSCRSWGRWEVPLLGLLTLLLCCLPFLHPRLFPLGFLLGSGVLLQTWHCPRRHIALAVVGLVVSAGLWTALAFHDAFSGDWMGPLRPGSGAWDEDALDVVTWSISLPGHWLHVGRGILNSSPIYFFASLGLLALARRRDRRVAVALALYAATAAVNGLHSNWLFGHDLPSRFLMTALPVLVMGLAWGLPLLLRSVTTAFFAALALAVSMEGVLITMALPEIGYNGENLLSRSVNNFYPLHQHFFGPVREEFPLLDVAFWGLLAVALFLRLRHPGPRWAIIAAAALAPFLWSRSDEIGARLQGSLSPYMARLSSAGGEAEVARPVEFEVPLRLGEEAQFDGRLRARPGSTAAGMVNFSQMNVPGLAIPQSGSYRLAFPGLRVAPPGGQVSGHLILSSRYTVQAVSPWVSRSSYPLIGGAVQGDHPIAFEIHEPGFTIPTSNTRDTASWISMVSRAPLCPPGSNRNCPVSTASPTRRGRVPCGRPCFLPR